SVLDRHLQTGCRPDSVRRSDSRTWRAEGFRRLFAGTPFQPIPPACWNEPLNSRARLALVEGLRVEYLRAVLRADRVLRRVHRHAGKLPLRVQDVEVQAEIRMALLVEQPLLPGVGGDPAERSHPGVLRVRAAPHLVDDQIRAQAVQVRLAPAGRPG